ncbi:MAG: tetratricopeptide repeat protein [Phaeodactylibacter sp.]|uniref:tetratricopeptide repeat protein n=1 Tax=Phaeodactylibacter sp. TaxID=1940289 RepID=UPI0032EB23BC
MNANSTNVRKEAYQLRQAFQFDAARTMLEEALQDSLPAEEQWPLHYELGKVFQDNFEMEKALEHYHIAIAGLEEASPEPSVFLARLYGACGLVHQDEGRETEALQCHHRAVEVLKQLPESEAGLFLASNLKYLGELYQEQSQLPESREHYRAALPLLQQGLGKGEGFLSLEAATVALQLAAVELELYLRGQFRISPDAIRQLLSGAQSWLEQLDVEDSIVEQRTADLKRLSYMLDKVGGA